MNACAIVLLLVSALGLASCVTKENYNAQVLRTNNFQRLLVEEEKRGLEVTAEVATLKEQIALLEAKNKALTVQFENANAQVVRSLEEVGRLQDDLIEARATAMILFGVRSAMAKASAPPSKSPTLAVPAPSLPSTEPPDRLDELQPGSAGAKKGTVVAPSPKAAAPGESFLYHNVKKGETLAAIAKRYKTDAKTVRELNDMAGGDVVRPGDRIIVGQKP